MNLLLQLFTMVSMSLKTQSFLVVQILRRHMEFFFDQSEDAQKRPPLFVVLLLLRGSGLQLSDATYSQTPIWFTRAILSLVVLNKQKRTSEGEVTRTIRTFHSRVPSFF
jgi:hypothetical protein